MTDNEFARHVSAIAAAIGIATGTLDGLKVGGSEVDESDYVAFRKAEESLMRLVWDHFAWSKACGAQT